MFYFSPFYSYNFVPDKRIVHGTEEEPIQHVRKVLSIACNDIANVPKTISILISLLEFYERI